MTFEANENLEMFQMYETPIRTWRINMYAKTLHIKWYFFLPIRMWMSTKTYSYGKVIDLPTDKAHDLQHIH